MKMSENYETEQRLLTDKVSVLKADMEKSKNKTEEIVKFVSLVDKYSDFTRDISSVFFVS